MTTFRHLFTPFRLGHVTLRNRIVSTPHATRFGKDGYITERYIRYHQEKARGGAGLVQCFGSASVHPSSPVLDWNGIKNWDDSSLPMFEAFARAIHGEGAHVMSQITHRGRARVLRSGRAASRVGLRRPRDGEPGDPPRARPQRDRRDRCRLRRRGAPPPARGIRRRRSLRLRAPPHGPVLGAVGEPADRRVRRKLREPAPLLGRGHPARSGPRSAATSSSGCASAATSSSRTASTSRTWSRSSARSTALGELDYFTVSARPARRRATTRSSCRSPTRRPARTPPSRRASRRKCGPP